MTSFRTIILALSASVGFGTTLSLADDAQQRADARTRVETATNLAAIAEAEKDGDALLVAARLLATAGSVAVRGAALADGKPTLYEVGDLVMKAKELGADPAKADEVAKMTTSATASMKAEGYWYYSCDSYNNCQWIYAGW